MHLSFHDHPASVGETYRQHMATAFGFGGRMLLGGLACLVHGVLPFAFTRTGSRTIAALHEQMVANRVRHAAGQSVGAASQAGSGPQSRGQQIHGQQIRGQQIRGQQIRGQQAQAAQHLRGQRVGA